MVFKSKTMKKGGKVKKTQKRIRGGNVLSYLKNFIPSNSKRENVSHTTVPDTPTQPTQPTQPMQSMQSMQQMQPVPPQQGGKKKYSKGRKGRKGGYLFQKDIPPQMKHGAPTYINCENPIEKQKYPAYCTSVHAAHTAAHGASQFGQSVKHGVSHLGHNVAEAARKGAIMTPSSMFVGSKRKSKNQRKTYKKKYSKAKKSRKMRR